MRRQWDVDPRHNIDLYPTSKYPDQHLTPDTDMHLDLGIDSMEWLNVSLEIRERACVELDDEAISRVASVRDLLREVTAGRSVSSEAGKDILDEPDQALSERQKKYFEPHGGFCAALARDGFAANRRLISLAFGLDVKRLEHLPADEFIITSNHASYLDLFVVAAVLDWPRMGRFSGAASRWPLLPIH